MNQSSGKKRKTDSAAGPKKKKRAPSAFMIFSQAVRPQVKSDHPDATFGELGKLIGAKWNELEEDEKNVRTQIHLSSLQYNIIQFNVSLMIGMERKGCSCWCCFSCSSRRGRRRGRGGRRRRG